jgi:hypothetical protein
MTPWELARHRQHVAHALGALEKATTHLVDALAHRSVWIAVEDASSDGIAVQAACAAYSAIDYGMEDDVGSSVVCLGVIGAAPEVLLRAEAVNAAKTALKGVCAPLQHLRMRVPVKDDAHPTKAIPVIRVILRNIQRSDLNLLAAYRKIPILAAPPSTVTYTRANTRSVYRKSIAAIREMLAGLEGPTAADDRARLSTLTRTESHLALVRQRYQNIRANVLYARLDRRGRGRRQIAAELPLMYALGRPEHCPQVNFPVASAPAGTEPRRTRQSQLDAQPFLQSLPVYRYST